MPSVHHCTCTFSGNVYYLLSVHCTQYQMLPGTCALSSPIRSLMGMTLGSWHVLHSIGLLWYVSTLWMSNKPLIANLLPDSQSIVLWVNRRHCLPYVYVPMCAYIYYIWLLSNLGHHPFLPHTLLFHYAKYCYNHSQANPCTCFIHRCIWLSWI